MYVNAGELQQTRPKQGLTLKQVLWMCNGCTHAIWSQAASSVMPAPHDTTSRTFPSTLWSIHHSCLQVIPKQNLSSHDSSRRGIFKASLSSTASAHSPSLPLNSVPPHLGRSGACEYFMAPLCLCVWVNRNTGWVSTLSESKTVSVAGDGHAAGRGRTWRGLTWGPTLRQTSGCWSVIVADGQLIWTRTCTLLVLQHH